MFLALFGWITGLTPTDDVVAWLADTFTDIIKGNVIEWSGADPGFQVRGGAYLKKICLGISCVNSRFYANKADYRISLLPLTSNSKNKTVVSKLHCMSNL